MNQKKNNCENDKVYKSINDPRFIYQFHIQESMTTKNYEEKIENLVREIHYTHYLGEYDSIEVNMHGEVRRVCYEDGYTWTQNYAPIGIVYDKDDNHWAYKLKNAREIIIDDKYHIAIPDDAHIGTLAGMGRLATKDEIYQADMTEYQKVRVIPHREAYDACDWESEIWAITQRLMGVYETIKIVA